jgi:hypothetical protein
VVERLERTVGIASAVRWLRNAHVAEQFGVETPTQKLQSFFSRWSIKFSAEYYEAKEQQSLRCPIVKQQRAANAEVMVKLKTVCGRSRYGVNLKRQRHHTNQQTALSPCERSSDARR